MEPVDTGTSRQIINRGARRQGVNVKGTEASERDERRRLRQSVEQANQTTFHAAKGSSEL